MIHFKHPYKINKASALLCCLLGLAVSNAWSQATQLYISGTSVSASKVYDGSTSCSIATLGTTSGINSFHLGVYIIPSAQYSDRHVGTNKTVIVTYTLQGPDANYYIPPIPDTLMADITPLPISITGLVVNNKIYDGTTTANINSFGHLVGVPAIDSNYLWPTCYCQFLQHDAGDQIPVYVRYSLIGANGVMTDDFIAPPADTLTATIFPRILTATGIDIAPSKTYDGNIYCPVTNLGIIEGILEGDTLSYSVSAFFDTPSAGRSKLVTTQIYTYGPDAHNYSIVDENTHRATIEPRPLQVTEPTVQLVKQFDSTDIAFVTLESEPTNVIGNDQINLSTTASYDNMNIGDNKDITVAYTLQGPQRLNYKVPDSYVYSHLGRILAPTILDTISNDGQVFLSMQDGSCQGTRGSFQFHIRQGEPSRYRIICDEATEAIGFHSTDGWIELAIGDSVVSLDIPDNCPEGDYMVTVQFSNIASGMIEYPLYFHVNIPSNYLMQMFDDVISIDNSGLMDGRPERFYTYQWYHNGQLINEDRPYHQEIGGLTGSYSVLVNAGTSEQGYVCPKVFVDSSKVSKIILYPSPVTTSTQIKLKGFSDKLHTLQIFNSFGLPIHTTSFLGIEYHLDMSTYPEGYYIINIDGVSIKTIKR